MKENGLMIRLTAKATINIWMEPNMRGIGIKINSMGMGVKYGQILQGTKDNMNMEKNMEMAPSIGRANQHMSENFIIIIFMEKVFTHGMMAESTKGNGSSIKWMAMEFLLGVMGENI